MTDITTNPIQREQQPGYLPRPKGLGEGTNLIIPPMAIYGRLRHFPEEVYSLDRSSHLFRIMAALLGDSGAAQLRKRLMMTRTQSSLQGTHFFDLDRFYGALLGGKRRVAETLNVDPYTSVLTNQQWEQVYDSDASFRSRMEQLAKGIQFGATAIAMELISEAVLNVDCDVYESFIRADKIAQTYLDLEDFTYGDLEAFTYGGLEANAPGNNPLFNRWAFTVVPKRPITLEERNDLQRILRIFKPASAFLEIEPLVTPAATVVSIRTARSDSEYWEVRSRVVSRTDVESAYTDIGTVADPREQPRPPFSAYQGESWSYMGDLAGVMGYGEFGNGGIQTNLYERVTFPDGTYVDYSSDLAVRPIQEALVARAASDGVMVSHPFGVPRGEPDARTPVFDEQGRRINASTNALAAAAPLFVDGLPMSDLAEVESARIGLLRRQQSPPQRFWSTPQLVKTDAQIESLEVRLRQVRRVNYVTFQAAHFPQRIWFEYWSEGQGEWQSVYTTTIRDSFPVNLISRVDTLESRLHPQHSINGHWFPIEVHLPPVQAKSFRVRMQRLATGVAPKDSVGREQAYSLGVKGLEVGYRIVERSDIPRILPSADQEIGNSLDILGSRISFDIRERPATNAIDGDPEVAWMSTPQPVGSAVVNLYLDTRTPTGDGQIVDRFFLDPVKPGPLMNVYWSNSEATGSFEAADDLLGFTQVIATGNYQATSDGMAFDDGDPSGFGIDNSYLQFDPTRDWWVGMSLRPRFAPQTAGAPLFSFGRFRAYLDYGTIAFQTPDDRIFEMPVDFVSGQTLKLVVSYTAATNSISFDVLDPDGVSISSLTLPMSYIIQGKPERFIIGSLESNTQHPEPGEEFFPDEDVFPGDIAINKANYVLRGLVLKQDTLVSAEDFFVNTYDYLVKHEFDAQDSGRTRNALLRFHIDHLSGDDFPFGLVGGPGDFYELLRWTPIPRDYTLQKGYINLPPTKAKHWKFEFSNLVAQPFEVYVPMQRRIKLFPIGAIPVGGQQRVDPGLDIPGYDTASGLYRTYQDTPSVDPEAFDPVAVLPTSALYSEESSGSQRLRELSWVYGFVPWHIGTTNPRFHETGVHRYDSLTFQHNEKVAFFVGIKEITAYLTDYASRDNPEAIVERFWSNAQLRSGITFNLSENNLNSAGRTFAEAESQVFTSRNPVSGVQYATQQTDAVQLIPDDDFRDSRLTLNQWDSNDTWHTHGDAVLRYLRSDQSVLISRDVQTIRAVDPFDLGIEQPPLHPVFALYDPEGGNLDDEGGIESGLVRVSPEGVVHAAARITAVTDLTNPIWLQIVDILGTVLKEEEITASAGDTVEWTASYVLGSYNDSYEPNFEPRTIIDHPIHPVFAGYDQLVDEGPGPANPGHLFRVRVIQKGASHDAWKVDRASLFDESITWEFSVDGGTTYVPAYGIRNNPNGLMSFNDVGAKLCYRVRAYRSNMHISALQIRPRYLDLPTLRAAQTYRGPNVSAFDQFPPIQDDPEFRRWAKPVPRWWWLEGQRYGQLPIEGYNTGNDFNRGYVRTAVDDIGGADVDEAVRVLSLHRFDVGNIPEGHDASVTDEATRYVEYMRSPEDDVAFSDDDFAYGNIIPDTAMPHSIPFGLPVAEENYGGEDSGDFEMDDEDWEP
jgi:hypothetical protein